VPFVAARTYARGVAEFEPAGGNLGKCLSRHRRRRAGTLRVLDLAQGQHVPLMVITEKGAVDKIDATAQAKGWMADVDPLTVLIAPQRAVAYGKSRRIGWWDINLRSGETLAVMDTGLHQAEEYSFINNEGRRAAEAIGMLLGVFAFPALLAYLLEQKFERERERGLPTLMPISTPLIARRSYLEALKLP